ncbi:hypothetical protein BGX24_004318, partial [Mortierella sp. AD032]
LPSGLPKLSKPQIPHIDADGMQQVVIYVGDSNIGKIFSKKHVKFIDRMAQECVKVLQSTSTTAILTDIQKAEEFIFT